MPERSYNLAVLRFPGNNSEHPASSGWVIANQPKWLKDPRILSVIPLRKSDTPITMVRNLLVKRALEEGADYILMIDSDMAPDQEPDGQPFWDVAWEFMMERRAREEAHGVQLTESPAGDWIQEELFRLFPPATIAAPYCGPPPDEVVYVFKWHSFETNSPSHPRPYEVKLFDRDHAAMFSGISQVAALATGLILYDARVFRRLPPPWFYYEWSDEYQSQKASTEDAVQTRNASLIGMPQYCAWDCWAGHVKPKVVRRPRPLCTDDVPDAMADAVRKGVRGDHRVMFIRSPEDAVGRAADCASTDDH